MKIAIVGAAPSTMNLAPRGMDWVIYGINRHAHKLFRHDQLFEMHAETGIGENYFTEDYVNTCKANNVICLPEMAGKLEGVAFPVDEAISLRGGRWYLQGTVSYMLAYAIMQGPSEIGIWGIDLADDAEYAAQRPCFESWIGYAEGCGIKITIPEQSALMSVSHRYGIDQTSDISKTQKGRDQLLSYIDYRLTNLPPLGANAAMNVSVNAQAAAYKGMASIIRAIERGADIRAALKNASSPSANR